MKRFIFICGMLIVFTGCGEKTPPPPVEPRITPEAEARALGAQIEAGISRGDAAIVNDRIDAEGILARVTRGEEIPEEIRQAFRERFRERLDFGDGIARAQTSDTSYRVVGLPEVDGYRRLRCRQLHPDGRVIYHDLVLEDVPEGDGYVTQIIDIYTHRLGESYSDTLRRMYIAMVLNTDQDIQARFRSGPDAEYARHFFKLQTILLFVEKGVMPSALKAHMILPEGMRKRKYILHQQLKLASMVSPAKEKDAVEAFRAVFPEDISLDLYLLSRLRQNGDYEGLMGLLPRLMAHLGEDAYLQYLYGMARFHTGEEREGITMLQVAIRAEPDLHPAHAGLFECLVRRGEFGPATDLLIYMKDQLGMGIPGLDRDPLYEELRNSPEYTRYKGAGNE